MKNTKIIICGTGRCGTKSLQILLGSCKNSIATHEFSPVLDWDFNEEQFKARLNHFKGINTKYYSDTGAWYLNYLERFIKEIPDIKIVVLTRDRQKVIPSYIAKCNKHNFWNNSHTDGSIPHNDYDNAFPDYGNIPIEEAISKFWDDYYITVNKLVTKYPSNFIVIDVVILNSIMQQHFIYNFLGIDVIDRICLDHIKENRILNL